MSSFVGEVVVGYWGIRGLGAPLRMMAMYAGVPLRCENYDLQESSEGWDASCWFEKKPQLKEHAPLINLPYVIVNGVIVSQSNACLMFLGRKLGMMGKSDSEYVECEQLLCEIMDLRNTVTSFAYGKASQKPEDFLKSIQGKNTPLAKLEQWKSTKSTSTAFFIGESACAADFHIWEILDQINRCSLFFTQAELLAAYPSLQSFHDAFAKLPQNAKYFSSALAQLPQNNLMAIYGATPSGAVFTAGSACPWRGSSGLY